MKSPYNLVTVPRYDIALYKKNPAYGKVGKVFNLVLDELPKELSKHRKFINPKLKPIEGFEDAKVKGFEVVIKENSDVEKFVRKFIPFFIMKK